MGITTRFLEPVEIKHVNVRKEGPDHEKVVAIDLKLTGLAKAEAITPLLGLDPGDDALGIFWDPEGKPRCPGILEVKTWDYELKDHTLRLGGLVFHGVTLKKFFFHPRDGFRTDLTFSATITSPTKDEISWLAENVQDGVPCAVEAPPELDLTSKGKAA